MANQIFEALRISAELFVYSAVAFCSLALLVEGRAAITGARRATSELRVNLAWYFADAVLVAPIVAICVAGARFVIDRYSLGVLNESLWSSLGIPLTGVSVLFIGDFVSYWRHRLEHTRVLWPAHAIHHSDSQMTWLTLARMHPVNRVVTGSIDFAALALLGFPEWALVLNVMVRHYYGEFIHADFPWTYGPLGRVFVSPAMHRWHHARDVIGAGSNFATVFSVFDQAFGTFYVPGTCEVPLGITDDLKPGLVRQFMYPFVCWFEEGRAALAQRQVARSIDTA